MFAPRSRKTCQNVAKIVAFAQLYKFLIYESYQCIYVMNLFTLLLYYYMYIRYIIQFIRINDFSEVEVKSSEPCLGDSFASTRVCKNTFQKGSWDIFRAIFFFGKFTLDNSFKVQQFSKRLILRYKVVLLLSKLLKLFILNKFSLQLYAGGNINYNCRRVTLCYWKDI